MYEERDYRIVGISQERLDDIKIRRLQSAFCPKRSDLDRNFWNQIMEAGKKGGIVVTDDIYFAMFLAGVDGTPTDVCVFVGYEQELEGEVPTADSFMLCNLLDLSGLPKALILRFMCKIGKEVLPCQAILPTGLSSGSILIPQSIEPIFDDLGVIPVQQALDDAISLCEQIGILERMM